jgi:hypothetical protein
MQRLVKILAPRDNQRDVLAAETFLGALADVRMMAHPVALEIAAAEGEVMFLVRGEAESVSQALGQIKLAYPQCEVIELAARDDPALPRGELTARAGAELRLREPAYLPIRSHISREGRVTNDDLARAADPMLSVIAAMTAGGGRERCLVQYVVSPADPDWSRYWRGSAGEVGERVQLTPGQMLIVLLGALGAGALGLSPLLLGLALLGRSLVLGLVGLVMLLAGVGMLYWRFKLPSAPDPLLIKQKATQAAYRVWPRAFVLAEDEGRARERLAQVLAAFSAYNLAGGNGFVPVALPDDLRPQSIAPTDDPFLDRLPFTGLARPASAGLPILSVGELAVLWHLPHASAGLQGVAYTASRRLLPPPGMSGGEGVLIGCSRLQEREVAVRLPAEALRGHIGLVAKTQAGKSNLMALLTLDVLARDPEAAVVVIDPHRTLAQRVAANLPAERVSNALYWSLADRERPFGLNLIDRMRAVDVPIDKLVDDIISALSEIWPDNWGPRMENYLRGPLLTLAQANEALVREWRFEQWLLEARATLGANAARVATGRLDDVARRMIGGLIDAFDRLAEPLRMPHAGLYRLCAEARRRPGVGDDDAGRVWLAQAWMTHAATELAADHDPRARLNGRVYDGGRPLQYTLLDVNRLLRSSQMQTQVLPILNARADQWHLREGWVSSYKSYYVGDKKFLLQMINPVTTKIDRFVTSDVARRIFGQPECTVDIPAILETGGVLIVDLAAGVVGQDTAALVGATVLNWLAAAIFARAERPGARPRRVFIAVDEFQAVPGADYVTYLSELAKYGAQLCLGTQSLRFLDQVNKRARAAWLDNTNALFVFRAGADDAGALAEELNTSARDPQGVRAEDIVGLPDYACFARVRDRGQPVVFRVETAAAPPGNPARLNALIAESRRRSGRPADDVERWLSAAPQGNDLAWGGFGRGASDDLPSATAVQVPDEGEYDRAGAD